MARRTVWIYTLLVCTFSLAASLRNSEDGEENGLTNAQTGVVPANEVVDVTDSAEDLSSADILDVFQREMAQLKQLVASLQWELEDHRASQRGALPNGRDEDAEETRQKPAGLIGKLVRRRRGVPATTTNETLHSDIATADNVSRTRHGSHWITTTGGTVYTHWGRSDCRNGSELVYTGAASGSNYANAGGGSNYLCMPMEPIYDQVEATAHGSRGLLYSAEYETSTFPALSDLDDQTPACAVCRAPADRLTKLMVPGRNECPSPKWRLEYRGYLMSDAASHTSKTEFICMDREAKAVPGTTGNQNGALFYMVESRCLAGGGLLCGPYVDGYELTCAVCTI